jgi:hypothetical protein
MRKWTDFLPISSIWVLVLIVSWLPLTFGQGGGQTITGTVRDTSGAVVPGASVIVTDIETGVKVQLETNSRGV